jgi:DNA repair exonuclease SbcCD ATPase subunit
MTGDLSDARMNALRIRNRILSGPGGLKAIERELSRMKRGGISAKEKERYDELRDNYKKLLEDYKKADDTLAERDEAFFGNLEERYNQQIEVVNQITEDINQEAERANAANEIQRRIATAMGRTSVFEGLYDRQIEITKKQIQRLQEEAASVVNDPEQKQQIEQQIAELEATIVETTLARVQAQIEQINNAAQRELQRVDLRERMLTATGQIGGRERLFRDREKIMERQMERLADALDDARKQGLDEVAEGLKLQMEELEVAIEENSRAQFMARIEEANAERQFQLQMLDLESRITTTKGELSGEVDQATLIRQAEARQKVLEAQRRDLEEFLDEAKDRDDEELVRQLTLQLKENELAILENSKQIKELNGTLNNTQTFTSRGWEQFRQATFTGMGGLMPNMQIPTGNILSAPGVAMPGSALSSQIFNLPGGSQLQGLVEKVNTNNININEVQEHVDPVWLSQVLAFSQTTQ